MLLTIAINTVESVFVILNSRSQIYYKERQDIAGKGAKLLHQNEKKVHQKVENI